MLPCLFAAMEAHTIFGANVKRERKRLGLSQEALADHAGLARSYMSDVERGAKNATIATVAKIALALDIEAGVLMQGIPVRQSR